MKGRLKRPRDKAKPLIFQAIFDIMMESGPATRPGPPRLARSSGDAGGIFNGFGEIPSIWMLNLTAQKKI
jgi:hypothetical protein